MGTGEGGASDDGRTLAERALAAEAQADPSDTSRLRRWVWALARLSRLDEAIDALDAGLKISPDQPDLLVERARISHRAGRLEEARASAGSLAAAHPSDPRAAQIRSEIEGDWAALTPVYAADSRAFPADPSRLRRWIWALVKTSAVEEALAVLDAGRAHVVDVADLLFDRILLLKRLGRVEEALSTATELAAAHPADERVRTIRAELAATSGDWTQIEPFHAAEARANPSDVWRLKRWLATLTQLGRYDDALAATEAGLVHNPDQPDLLVERTRLLRRMGRPSDARSAALALEAAHPSDPRLPVIWAEMAEMAGDWSAAERLYAEDARRHPADSLRLRRWVMALAQLSRYDDALSAIEECLRLNPGNADLQVERIRILRRAGRLEDAHASANALAETNPDDPRALTIRAEFAETREDWATAERLHAEDAGAHPNDLGRQRRWAWALAQLARYDQALVIVERSLERTPLAPELLIERVRLLRLAGRLEEAGTAAAFFAAVHPGEPRLPQMRAELAEAGGDWASAAEIYAADYRSHPADVGRLRRWAVSLVQLSRYDDALLALDVGLARAPNAADLMFERARTLTRIGDFDEAHAATEALAAAHPHDLRLSLLRAEFAEATGDAENAEKISAAGVAAFPKSAVRRLRHATALMKLARHEDALATIAEAPAARSSALRLTEINLLMQAGRWSEARERIDAWPANDAQGRLQRHQAEMNFALMRLDYAEAEKHASAIIAAAPTNAAAPQGLAWAAIGNMSPDVAWNALAAVPGKALDGGTAAKGTGRLRTLAGQITNELRLSGSANGLEAAASGGDERLIETAAELVRSDSRSFGPALGLVTACGRTGRMTFRARAGHAASLPKLLHQYWDTEDAPPDVERVMAQSRAANSDRISRTWRDASARAFLRSFADTRVRSAYEAASHAAMRSDIFRYAALYEFGGAYLDADDLALTRLTELIPPGAEFVCYHESLGSIGNNFLAAAPGNAIVGRILDQAVETVLAGAGESVWLTTGPGLVTRVLASAIAAEPGVALPEGVKIVNLESFRGVVRARAAISYRNDRRNWQNGASPAGKT